jgi:PAS domain S-box-containing protein
MVHSSPVTIDEANAEFQRLSDNPDAVHWTMAMTGEITYVSPSVEKLRGITPEEARVQAPDGIHPPESLKTSLAYFEDFSRHLLAGQVPPPFVAALEYLHRDGSGILCDVVAIPQLDEAGQVIGLAGVSVPVE